MYSLNREDSQPLSERVLLHPGFETACRLIETTATLVFISISLREHASPVLFWIAVGFGAMTHMMFCGTLWSQEFYRNKRIRVADEAAITHQAIEGQVVSECNLPPYRPPYRPADRSHIARVVIALPVINYVLHPVVISEGSSHPEFLGVTISWCSLYTFPQYVICLCYALDGRPLSYFWCAAMMVTTLYILLGPFHAIARHDHHHGGYWHIFSTCLIWYLPIVLLELVHFFPIFFAYYYYHSITKTLLLNYLLVFNVPKVLFLLLRLTNEDDSNEYGRARFLVCKFPPVVVPLLIVPLVPSVLMLTHVIGVPNWGSMPEGFIELLRTKCFAYRWNLTLLGLYLWLAYGGLLHLVLTQQSPGLVVQASVFATTALSVVVLAQHLSYKLSHFKIMPMWCQDGHTASMYGEFQCRNGVKYSLNQPEAKEDLIGAKDRLTPYPSP